MRELINVKKVAITGESNLVLDVLIHHLLFPSLLASLAIGCCRVLEEVVKKMWSSIPQFGVLIICWIQAVRHLSSRYSIILGLKVCLKRVSTSGLHPAFSCNFTYAGSICDFSCRVLMVRHFFPFTLYLALCGRTDLTLRAFEAQLPRIDPDPPPVLCHSSQCTVSLPVFLLCQSGLG